MFHVIAHLRDTKTKRVYIHRQLYDCDSYEVEYYYWTEGSMACDCNRSLIMYGYMDYKCNVGSNIIVLDQLVVEETREDLLTMRIEDMWQRDGHVD